MQDHDALGRQECVPSGLDTIFQQVVLIRVGIVGHLDGGAAIGVERSHAVIAVLLGIDEVHPTHEVTLIGSVACRTMAVVQVTAVVHDVPTAHAIGVAVVGRIEIGQTQTMTKLVAEGTHTVDIRAGVVAAFQLVEHGKPVDGHPVELERSNGAATPIVGFFHIPLAGPHALGHRAPSLRFTHTGIEHDHNIDKAVAVVVIVGEIHIP